MNALRAAFLSAALSATCLAAAAAPAAPVVDVDFAVTLLGRSTPDLYGEFTGVDANRDGTLTFAELATFEARQPGASVSYVTLGELDGFGSYTVATNTWNADAASWAGQPSNAWFTWNLRSDSAALANASVTTMPAASTVPEPASLALLSLGALAFAARVRRAA